MIWTALILCFVTLTFGNKTDVQLPFFHGHVFENSPPGSKVNGISIPFRRTDAQEWCAAAGTHVKLLGQGSDHFHVFAHHKSGHFLLRTAEMLDREEQSEYIIGLGLCCQSCDRAHLVVAEVASLKIDILDTNDHEPTFPYSDVKITLDDATAIRSVVFKAAAHDIDSGKNAELIYFTLPKNNSFYAVPKTGDIILVDSILGFASPINFEVFARDRGWPSRTSKSLKIEINPRLWAAAQPPHSDASTPGISRRSRSLLVSDSALVINVSEDAGIGSVVMNLMPVKFQTASFELMNPSSEASPVMVSRDSGDVVIARRLDRETEPVIDMIVKIQDKQGECNPISNRDLVELCHSNIAHLKKSISI